MLGPLQVLQFGAAYGKEVRPYVRNPTMQESTVTIKGQTTLPRDVRAALGLTSGDKLRYVILDGEVRILKAHSVKELRGMLYRPERASVSLRAMDEAIATGAANSAGDDK
jgi:antitoxin PrlF